MDKQTLEQANKITNTIERLKRVKEKLTWYVTNERLNKTSIVGFGTTSSKMIDGDSIINDSIYPFQEIVDEYSRRLDNEITGLQTELDLL